MNIHSILAMPFASKKQALDTLAPLAVKMLKGEVGSYSESKEIREALKAKTEIHIGCNDNGVIAFTNAVKMSDAPAGSIALIRVNGFISQDGGWCSKGLVDYKAEMEAAGNNRNIKGVILQVNSSGGSIEGVQNFSDFVGSYERKYKKPIAALVESMADSAGYYIIAQAPRIFTNGEAVEIGSIGTMVTLHDYSAMLEMEGIKEIIINASMSANKNKPYYNALGGDTAGMIEYLDKYNNMFLRTVQRGRNGKLDLSVETQITMPNESTRTVAEVLTGKVYVGTEVIRMGLADEVSDMDGVVKYIEQRASEMGYTDSTTLVEVEENEDMEQDYYMGYNQNNHTIMFKNLSQETLQSTLTASKMQLEEIAKDKGVSSAEYSRKANEVGALETELELRQYKNQSIELTAKLEKATADLVISEKNVAEYESKLEKATSANAELATNELNAKVEKLTAENESLQAAKEQLSKELQSKSGEASELTAQVEKLTTENAGLNQQVEAYNEFFQNEGIQPPAVKQVSFPKESGDQPEGSKDLPALSEKEMAAIEYRKMMGRG